MGQMKVLGKIATAFSQKAGQPDAQGRLTAETTYDQVSMEMTMNGNPLPLGETNSNLAGKKFAVIYDREGKIVDVKALSDLGLPPETLKQMMMSFSNMLPPTAIGVGETVSAPFSMALPLPVPGTNGLSIEGQTKSKLVSLTTDGTDRLAKLDQTLDGKFASAIEIPGPNGNLKMNIDLKMSGGGNLDWSMDKNLIKNSQMQSTFDATINMAGDLGGIQIPTIKLRGKIKMTIAQTN